MRLSTTVLREKSTVLRGIAVVIVFGVIGGVLLFSSHAATPTAAVEAENGTLSTAVAVNDSTASGGKAVKFKQQTAISKVKIWPIGDSISAGNNPTVENGYRLNLWNNLTNEGYSIDYVGSFQWGTSALPDQDADVSGGACIMTCAGQDSLLNDFTKPYLAQFNPDIVIIEGGGNDFQHASDQAAIAKVEGYMQTWIQYFLNYNPNIYVIAAGTTDYDTYPTYMAWLQQYATQLQGQGKHVYYLNINVETSDSVHPDLTGYQQITTNLMPIINPIMQTLTGH